VTKITVETKVKSDIDTVWQAWNNPDDIRRWNAASDDWHTTRSTVDLRNGGRFSSRMEAKDGSMGFDFSGTYTAVVEKQYIAYSMDDDRKVEVRFSLVDDGVKIEETFEAESQHPADMQRDGWQSILSNFARYVEALG